jgi:Tfp pilus assembly protein PilN
MRAVNLIPADQRRASGAAGKSGGGVYVVLGVLALLVAFVAALTFTGRQVSDRTAEADRLESQAQVAQAKAGNLASYKEFDAVVKTRSASVRALAATRFDWGASLDQVSRVVPSDVSLTQLSATVTPGVGVGGVVSLRSALTNPAIELVGCAPSQSRVALLMARLRRLEGVQRVSVANSAKTAGASSSQGSKSETSSTGSCQTNDRIPQFQMVVFFGTPQAVAATQTGTSGSVKAAIDTINGGTNGTTTTPAPAAPGH